MKRYMHGMSVLALLAGIASHDVHASRRNPLRVICAGIGWASIVSIERGFEIDAQKHYKSVHPLSKPIATIAGLLVGGALYGVSNWMSSSESHLESAHEALEIIIQENAIARKIPKDAESCLALLRGMYKGDLWFFQAIHKLQNVQDQLSKIIDDVEKVRSATAGDIAFVAQCRIVSERASQALCAVGMALMYARSELTNQSEKLHTIEKADA